MAISELRRRFTILWEINPLPQNGYEYGCSIYEGIIIKNLVDNQGTLIDHDYLLEKYRAYFNYMKQFDRGQYTKNVDKPKRIAEWLLAKGWESKLVNIYDPLDFYLYGITDPSSESRSEND